MAVGSLAGFWLPPWVTILGSLLIPPVLLFGTVIRLPVVLGLDQLAQQVFRCSEGEAAAINPSPRTTWMTTVHTIPSSRYYILFSVLDFLY